MRCTHMRYVIAYAKDFYFRTIFSIFRAFQLKKITGASHFIFDYEAPVLNIN